MTTYRTLHDMQEAMDRTAKHIERRAEELEQQAAAVRVADAQITLPLEAPCVGQSAVTRMGRKWK
jgi:hypothetical protein